MAGVVGRVWRFVVPTHYDPRGLICCRESVYYTHRRDLSKSHLLCNLRDIKREDETRNSPQHRPLSRGLYAWDLNLLFKIPMFLLCYTTIIKLYVLHLFVFYYEFFFYLRSGSRGTFNADFNTRCNY